MKSKSTRHALTPTHPSSGAFPPLDTADAGVHLSVASATLAKWRRVGGGPPFLRLGSKSVRYKVEDLDQWLESRRVTT